MEQWLGSVKMSDPSLRQYVEDNVYRQLMDELDEDYTIECIQSSSIMFFLANSYAYSANVLLDKINEGFETKSDYRIISKLVIPYMFNTRHYIELELKGLIARLKDNKGHASNEHDLRKLIEEFETCLKSYTYDQVGDEYYKRSLYEKNMTIVMERFDSAKSINIDLDNITSFCPACGSKLMINIESLQEIIIRHRII